MKKSAYLYLHNDLDTLNAIKSLSAKAVQNDLFYDYLQLKENDLDYDKNMRLHFAVNHIIEKDYSQISQPLDEGSVWDIYRCEYDRLKHEIISSESP